MGKDRTVVIAVSSDQHCGSSVGLAPPKVRLDDGGTYEASKPQAWLWDCWNDFWGQVERTRRREKADLWCLYNGDLFEGDHHRTVQLVSNHPEAQGYIADRVFDIPRKLKPKHQFVVRGTEAHAGSAANAEEARARWMGAEPDAVTGTWSHWHLRLNVHGIRIDCKHHGRMGTRPWTEANPVAMLAFQIWAEHAKRDIPHPQLAIRSHRHRFADSFHVHRTRVVQTGAWQLMTAYAHRACPESMADVGGVVVIVQPDGAWTVQPILYQPEPPPLWSAP